MEIKEPYRASKDSGGLFPSVLSASFDSYLARDAFTAGQDSGVSGQRCDSCVWSSNGVLTKAIGVSRERGAVAWTKESSCASKRLGGLPLAVLSISFDICLARKSLTANSMVLSLESAVML